MRTVLFIAVSVALAAVVFALADQPVAGPSAQVTSPGASEAQTLLKQVAAAYKKAPTISDSLVMEFAGPFGQEKQPGSILLGKGDNARFQAMGMIMTTLNGQMYLEMDDAPGKYVQRKLEGGIPQTAAKLSDGNAILPFQYLMRFGSDDAGYIRSLTMGMLKNAALEGVQQVEDENGSPLHEINIKGVDGTAKIHVDSKTKLIRKQLINITPAGAQPGQGMNMTVNFKPVIAEELKSPITFEPGSRKMVRTLKELDESQPGQIGGPAVDFTLQTPEGKTVALKDLRGQVVVLDFWATWCGWCIKAMPFLQEFHDWTQSSGQPIQVFAVNCWERKTTDQVVELWNSKGWTIPILLDAGDKIVTSYGFSGIPATVVVGPDGKVANIHRGYSPEMVKMLKEDAAKALKQAD